VGGFLTIRRDSTPEAVQVDVLVCVVELQNLTDTVNYLQILVLKRVKVMKTVPICRSAVGQRKVDGD